MISTDNYLDKTVVTYNTFSTGANSTTDTLVDIQSTQNKGKSLSGGIVPFIRYYLLKKSHKLNIPVELSYEYAMSKTTVNINESITSFILGSSQKSQNNYSGNPRIIHSQIDEIAVQSGISCLIDKNIALYMLAGYTYYDQSHSHYNIFGLSVGFQVYLPFRKNHSS